MFLKLTACRKYHELTDIVSALSQCHHVGGTCIYRIMLNLVSQCHTAGVAVYD